MGLRGFFATVLSSGMKVITNFGAKAVTGPVKDVSGTVKDVTRVRRDIVETKLAQFKLEEHESLIQNATLNDVESYDPKTRRIIRSVNETPKLAAGPGPTFWSLYCVGLF